MNQSTNIETVAQYFDAVRTAGVWIDNQHITSEGEGRSTRYFVDGEKASKSDARDAFDAARESGVAILVGDEANRQIRCLACGGSVGYLTGSHMKSHEDGLPQSIAEYRAEYGDDTPSHRTPSWRSWRRPTGPAGRRASTTTSGRRRRWTPCPSTSTATTSP